MKIKIEASAAELAALEIITVAAELGAEEAAPLEAPERVKARAAERAGDPELAAAWRARDTASLSKSPLPAPAALKTIEEWMAARRGWSFTRADVVDATGPRWCVRATFQLFPGAGRLHGASLEVWLDAIGGHDGRGQLRAMLPPCHQHVPALAAELDALIARFASGPDPLIHPFSAHVTPPHYNSWG